MPDTPHLCGYFGILRRFQFYTLDTPDRTCIIEVDAGEMSPANRRGETQCGLTPAGENEMKTLKIERTGEREFTVISGANRYQITHDGRYHCSCPARECANT